MSSPAILALNHRLIENARLLHAIQQAAYSQEAILIGALDFPALKRTVEDLQGSSEQFIGAYLSGALVGAVSLEPFTGQQGGVTIASLTVKPEFHRQGIGAALVGAVLAQPDFHTAFVSTAVKNLPALSLYLKFGFAEYERSLVGSEQLEIAQMKFERRHIFAPGLLRQPMG